MRGERRADDAPDLTDRFRELRRTGARQLRNELVTEHLGLAEAIARRFANRGEQLADLEQVATVGLVKAVERFDPEQGVPFAGFAVPTITGEVQRHFRDATWSVKVPRGAKDLHVRVRRAVDQMQNSLGRSPTPRELAEELRVSEDEVLAALDAEAAYTTVSTDTPQGEVAANWASRGPGIAPDDRVMLERLLATLDERERTIVGLRFFEELSQSEIAERVGVSQVHVSRLLRQILRRLRQRADGDPAQPADR